MHPRTVIFRLSGHLFHTEKGLIGLYLSGQLLHCFIVLRICGSAGGCHAGHCHIDCRLHGHQHQRQKQGAVFVPRSLLVQIQNSQIKRQKQHGPIEHQEMKMLLRHQLLSQNHEYKCSPERPSYLLPRSFPQIHIGPVAHKQHKKNINIRLSARKADWDNEIHAR